MKNMITFFGPQKKALVKLLIWINRRKIRSMSFNELFFALSRSPTFHSPTVSPKLLNFFRNDQTSQIWLAYSYFILTLRIIISYTELIPRYTLVHVLLGSVTVTGSPRIRLVGWGFRVLPGKNVFGSPTELNWDSWNSLTCRHTTILCFGRELPVRSVLGIQPQKSVNKDFYQEA